MLNPGSLIQLSWLSWGFSPGLSPTDAYSSSIFKTLVPSAETFYFNTLKLIHQVVGTSYLEWECK